ncbi:MAG TPA: 3'-5' exonuclease [Ferrovibrio sp.]|uniref:3'-5' exonuclease n=1 Tax=Ferrovibrio sp. TaxID=1917215 RepID=UPI002ED20844
MLRRSADGLLSRLIGAARTISSRAPARLGTAASFPADEPLATLPVAILDTETTGLNVAHDRLLAVAGLHSRGSRLETAPPLDYLVYPGIKIPKRAIAIHGIDDRKVAAAPPFALIWPSIQIFWHRRVLVGHNIAFDLALLRHEAERHRLAFHPPAAAIDIGMLYAGLKPRAAAVTLDAIARALAVEIAGRHSALGDAEAAAAIWRHLLPALAGLGVGTLGGAQALIARQRDLMHGQGKAGWAVDLLLPHKLRSAP